MQNTTSLIRDTSLAYSPRAAHPAAAARWAVPALLLASIITGAATAQFPDGGDPGPGVSIQPPAGNTMNIHSAGSHGIIDWASFDLGNGMIVNFHLPSASAKILNRVTGAGPAGFGPSIINGTIWSQGNVYIVNPAGVTFGPNAMVDVGGIYAAAGNITNTDFLNDIDHFTDLSGTVTVGGKMEAKNIHLFGQHVINQGVIRTTEKGGLVAMAAGNDVLLGTTNGKVFVRIDGTTITGDESFSGYVNGPAPDLNATPGVWNKESVIADGGGRIIMGAGDMYALAIRNSGRLSAQEGEINLAGTNGAIHITNTIETGVLTAAADEIHLDYPVVLGSSRIDLNDPTLLGTDVRLITPQLNARDTIDSKGGGGAGLSGYKLTVDGNALFEGAVGGQQALRILIVGGDASIFGGEVTTTETQTYDGAVTIGEDTVLTGALITFNGTVDGDTNGGQALLVVGDVDFDANVGSGNALASLTVDGQTLLGGDVNADAMNFIQAFVLKSDAAMTGDTVEFGSTVNGPFALLIDASDLVHFGGNIGTEDALNSLDVSAGNLINFAGQQVIATGDVLLNKNGRTDVPTVATIVGLEDLSIISENGEIAFGQNEKLTVLGNLLLEAMNGSITVGDVNSLGNMDLMAPTIQLLTREGGQVLLADGTLVDDEGLDLVAGGTMNFMVTPILLGDGSVVFASGSADSDANSAIGDQFEIRMLEEPLTLEMLTFDGSVLDLVAPGVTPPNGGGNGPGPGPGPDPDREINLAEALPGAPADNDDPQADPFLPTPLQRAALAQLNIVVRDMRPDEVASRMDGAGVMSDVPATIGSPSDRIEIASYRLRRETVARVLNQYADLFLEQVRNEETGTIEIIDRRPEARQVISAAWRAYRQRTANPTAEAFRAFVAESEEYADAAAYLRGLDDLSRDFELLGVSPAEVNAIRSTLLRSILPANMPAVIARRLVNIDWA